MREEQTIRSTMTATRQEQFAGRWLSCLLIAACVSGCAPVAAQDAARDTLPSPAIIRYDSIHHPVVARYGMVVSQNVLASQIGRQILEDGGNAIDSAVAVGFALAVTLPRAGNLGGSGFMLVHMAESGETVALDYRSAAPAGLDLDKIRDAEGNVDRRQINFGPLAPGVPGTVAGLYEAWQRFGSLPWAEVVEPAIELAASGIRVTDDLAFALANAAPVMSIYPASVDAYLKADGTPYDAGEHLAQPDLAWSLRAIRDGGADAFYRGPIAERIARNLGADGGVITLDDLDSYRVKVREPIVGNYRDHRVLTMPPVSGGGITLVQMLKVLEHFDLKSLGPGSAQSLHVLAETMKQSAANRRITIGDPDFVEVPIRGYISDAMANTLAARIKPDAVTPVADITPMNAQPFESRETTHYSVVDRHGNAVSNTYTLGASFGSGYVVPETGILLDNQIRNFTYGQDGHANAIAPGKRMVSTMTPTIVLAPDGEVLLVTGTPGGSRIINVILQVIVNVVEHGMNVAEATHAPRIHQQWRTPNLGVERGISVDAIALLEKMGHVVEQQQTMGSTQSIVLRDGLLYGAADPRRPGALAVGVNALRADDE